MAPSEAPAGLYIHVPFCSAICPYCDFAVTTGAEQLGASLVEGIERELERADPPPNVGFDTIYLGGGTPSALKPALLARLLESVQGTLRFEEDTRITLEANPEDVDGERVSAWRQLGVHTLSLGVQSFHDPTLRFLGRRHCAKEARLAVETALNEGFECVSIDLIFGLPESVSSAPEGLDRSLGEATALSPPHVSCYQLTFHGATPFGRAQAEGRLKELDETSQHGAFALVHERLAEGGWEAYEVSNFAAAPRFRSRHNQKYWSHTSYVGLGPSAHSFRGSRRWWNERDLKRYLALVEAGRRPIAGTESLSASDLALEYVMLRLRTSEGLSLRDLESRYGVGLLSSNEQRIARLVDEGRLLLDDGWLRPTVEGLAVADGIVASLEVSVAS